MLARFFSLPKAKDAEERERTSKTPEAISNPMVPGTNGGTDGSAKPTESTLRGEIEFQIPALVGQSVRAQCAAVQSLGFSGHTAAIDQLVTVLNDGERELIVRSAAATALGSTRNVLAVDPLVTLLSDSGSNSETRCRAASALGEISDPRAVAPLVAVLRQSTVDTLVRSSAALALGEIGDLAAIDPLVAARDDPNLSLKVSVTLSLTRIRAVGGERLGTGWAPVRGRPKVRSRKPS